LAGEDGADGADGIITPIVVWVFGIFKEPPVLGLG
jgi:hypothetical protein